MRLSHFKSSPGVLLSLLGVRWGGSEPFPPFSSMMGRLGKRNGHDSTELVAGLEGNLVTLAHPTVPNAPSLILLEVACGVAAGQTQGVLVTAHCVFTLGVTVRPCDKLFHIQGS